MRLPVHLVTQDSEFASNYAEEIRKQRWDDGQSPFRQSKRKVRKRGKQGRRK